MQMLAIGIILNIDSPQSQRLVERFLRSDFRVIVIYLSLRSHKSYIRTSRNQIGRFSNLVTKYHGKLIKIKSPNLGFFDYFLVAKKLKTIIQKNELDVIFPLYGGGLALLTYLSKFKPYFLYLMGSDVLRTNYLTETIGKKTYSAAKTIFVHGKYLMEMAEKKFGLKNCQLAYIGVDIEKFLPTKKSQNKINLISTRGFLPVYNNRYVIEALSHLNRNNGINHIVFAAGGPRLDQEKKFASERLHQNIYQKIKFLGGIGQGEMIKQLQNSSIFISVSKSDGQAISLMEAMACGVFPILSDIPANREWIKPEWKNGIIVPLGQPKKLAAAIEKAASDEKLRRNAAKINRQIAVKHFNSEKNLNSLVQEIKKSILEKKNK